MWKIVLKILPFSAIVMVVSMADAAVTIDPPTRARSILQLIESVARAVTLIALPFATVAIIFVGFKFVIASAQGNQSSLGEAKKMFGWVLLGTAILVGASVLARVAVNIAETL